MREILFRGKRTDGGEWIYGVLIKNSVIDPFTYISKGTGYKIYDTEIGKPIKILPGTTGQYTGLTDKNGKKIFEGDIVLRHDKKAEVRYQPSEFVLVFPDNPYPQCGLLTTSYLNENKEVIGNIHDNPELLKEAT